MPYTTATSQVQAYKNCAGCGQPLHLVQDNTGSAWYHATSAADYQCHLANGFDYGDGQA